MNKKVLLLILDGWGKGKDYEGNAVTHANSHFVEKLDNITPHSMLQTSGEAVGLPEGQMGNSEVGHLNIGAGRVVYQQLVLINKSFREGTVKQNKTLIEAFNYALANNKNVHFIGLVSDGGVHSHINHLIGLCQLAEEFALPNVYIHAFMDGRDTDPKSGLGYIQTLEKAISNTHAKIASLTGRYYAMDRDKRWERVKLAYDAMVHGIGQHVSNIEQAIHESYAAEVTDEFMKPIIMTDRNQPIGLIQDGDVVINFNFRTDRGREISEALTQEDFHEQNMHKLNLKYITMTTYDETYKNVETLFDNDDLIMTLGEVLEKNGKTQIRIAETEKYPHVTFFFSGGRESEFLNEKRYMCPSPKVATYDLQPEMSAEDVKNATIKAMTLDHADFIVTNFANPDMVGHTGVLSAVIKAIEKVDACVEEIVSVAKKNNYTLLITADHGNSEYMINDDGTPNTAHTTNDVPLRIIDPEIAQLHNGKLADLAPTILKLMGIAQPSEMTGKSLI
ncbi:MAG: 2,3-bisphosphoglycerate-independent phosphoglycerate mutase [Bacteroidetes bacterium]|nr:2,3-bisphosphoglycerate-independent phosphoglycerate mutase [Bacteroidota bacterium]